MTTVKGSTPKYLSKRILNNIPPPAYNIFKSNLNVANTQSRECNFRREQKNTIEIVKSLKVNEDSVLQDDTNISSQAAMSPIKRRVEKENQYDICI